MLFIVRISRVKAIAFLAIVFLAMYFLLPCCWIAVGLWKREAFYQYRPTSYWRMKVQRCVEISDGQLSITIRPGSLDQSDLTAGLPVFTKDKAVGAVLLQLLRDDDDSVKMYAILVAQSLRSEAVFAIPYLKELANDPNVAMARMANSAIYLIEEDGMIK
jgi:hypothetical protein